MRIIFILIGFCCLLACRAGAAQPATQPPVATSGAPGTIRVGDGQITYYAQAGDTLSSIAQQLTTRSGNWVALGKLNRISKDISIPIGTAIVIPADLLPDEPNEARIVAFSGSVSASAANGAAVRIAPGSVLREGASLTTGANSFLTLALADQSRISIPSNSHVGLSRLRMARYTNSPRTEISILQGRVEARVAPLNFNQGRFEVRSPQSVTGVRGTHFRVAVTEERVGHGVLDGSVALTRPGVTPSLILRQGQGAVISAAGTPTAVDLLPPPQLASAPAADGAALRFEVLPVAGASRLPGANRHRQRRPGHRRRKHQRHHRTEDPGTGERPLLRPAFGNRQARPARSAAQQPFRAAGRRAAAAGRRHGGHAHLEQRQPCRRLPPAHRARPRLSQHRRRRRSQPATLRQQRAGAGPILLASGAGDLARRRAHAATVRRDRQAEGAAGTRRAIRRRQRPRQVVAALGRRARPEVPGAGGARRRL